MIGVNAQRVEEYKGFAQRDRMEIETTRVALEEVKMQSESLEQKTQLLTDSLTAAQDSLADAESVFNASQKKMDELRVSVQTARTESVQLEREATAKREELMKLKVRYEQDAIDDEESVAATIGGVGDAGRRLLDCVVVADVYAAGEQPIDGVSKNDLVDGLIAHGHRHVVALENENKLPEIIKDLTETGDIVICLGAGSVSAWAHALPEKLEELGKRSGKNALVHKEFGD